MTIELAKAQCPLRYVIIRLTFCVVYVMTNVICISLSIFMLISPRVRISVIRVAWYAEVAVGIGSLSGILQSLSEVYLRRGAILIGVIRP